MDFLGIQCGYRIHIWLKFLRKIPAGHYYMHGLVLLFQNVYNGIYRDDSTIQKSQNLIKQKKIAFLCHNNLAGKIQSVEDIGPLLRFLFLSKLFITSVPLFKTENLEIQIVQILHKIQ